MLGSAFPMITFIVPEHPASSPLHTVVTFPTPLEVFARHGGLALLAEHLPLVYPETLRYSTQDKPAPTASSPDAMDADWVKVDGTHIDLYEASIVVDLCKLNV